ETILSKLETSSRMKDYYDIYLIYKFKFDKINKDKFKGAIERTFRKRKFNDNLIRNLNIVKESSILKNKWLSYSRKNSYARKIEFEETLKCLEQFVNII
ncbi:nucleotidyl transferase AbiEii/AbiGii toxin family protein, partial [bacterium]|nr:nucleotidyl transferase AbiEii/AbiGii toxin family protein [bacterium]